MKMKSWLPLAAILIFLSAQAHGATKDEVVKRGFLQCGVAISMPGFSNPDNNGNWSGMDTDICRAVAAAVLGDSSRVKFMPLTARERFLALQAGEVDMLARNTTWTLTRDTSLGLHFAGVSYFDGQGFMVKKSMGVKRAAELDGVAVCTQSGTTTELNLADFFKQNNLKYKAVLFDTSDQTVKGFESGRCDVLTSGISLLYSLRSTMARPEDAVVLPDVISKEPLGPVVRQGDDVWFNIVKWSLFALINAEELGLSSTNIETKKNSTIPAIRRFVGTEGIGGQGLGLADDWAYRIIHQVGNYGEIYERNVGGNSPLNLSRGLNELWTRGGLHYAPPIR